MDLHTDVGIHTDTYVYIYMYVCMYVCCVRVAPVVVGATAGQFCFQLLHPGATSLRETCQRVPGSLHAAGIRLMAVGSRVLGFRWSTGSEPWFRVCRHAPSEQRCKSLMPTTPHARAIENEPHVCCPSSEQKTEQRRRDKVSQRQRFLRSLSFEDFA